MSFDTGIDRLTSCCAESDPGAVGSARVVGTVMPPQRVLTTAQYREMWQGTIDEQKRQTLQKQQESARTRAPDSMPAPPRGPNLPLVRLVGGRLVRDPAPPVAVPD
jgi:hypothetical protein